jgi:hypothetical protein
LRRTKSSQGPCLVEKKNEERVIRAVKSQAWVSWLQARGKTQISPEEPERLQAIYGDAPPLETPDGLLLNDQEDNSSTSEESVL